MWNLDSNEKKEKIKNPEGLGKDVVMKKIILVIILISALMLNACGSNTETKPSEQQSGNAESTVDEVKEKPLDLIGNWAQEGKEFDDSYQAGYISGDRIEIFWMSDGGESSALYWSGTYEPPQEETDEYAWDSNNDKTQTDSALLASGADQKFFTYKDGKISYEASAMGQTATIYLVPSETDYISSGTATESADTSNLKEIELIDSGYSISESGGNTTILYAVDFSNPNTEYAIEFPKISITAKDIDGKILKTEKQVLNGIAAEDEYTYGSSLSYEGDAPATVEISVGNSDDDYVAQSSSGIIQSGDLSVSNISENSGTYKTFTGEVTNNSAENLDGLAITVIYKSGDSIVGGETSYADELKSGETQPFEVSVYSDFADYDSYEIHALQW